MPSVLIQSTWMLLRSFPGCLKPCWLLFALCGVFLTACAHVPPPKEPVVMTPETFARQLPGPAPGLSDWMELAPGLEASLRYVRARAAKAASGGAAPPAWFGGTWGQLELTLAHLRELLPRLGSEPELLAREFVWKRVEPDVLLTGYYEPFLDASLEPRLGYATPIYALPPNLIAGDERYTRAAIDQYGALTGRGLEIAWAKDPVDVFFLHVQGSGRLLLPDGQEIRVRYAGSNGQEYVSLGKALVEMGYAELEEMSMQKIREILSANPGKCQNLMSINPKYIFFSLAHDGPYGATGAQLIPMASCAVDADYIPMGSVLALSGELPPEGAYPYFQGIVLAHDTGTMERNHLDLFCGSGPPAADMAGRMRGRAQAWMLLSKRCASAPAY